MLRINMEIFIGKCVQFDWFKTININNLNIEIEEEYVKKTKESIWKPISSTNTTPY